MVELSPVTARPKTRTSVSRITRKGARSLRKLSPLPALPRPRSVVEAIGAAAAAPTWYVAKFVATAGQATSDERRTSRWGLRGLLRQEGVSALPRVEACGRPIGNNPIKVKARSDGSGIHFAGLETCASVWSCPVCAATIRSHRADEIQRGLAEHLRAPTKAEKAAGYKATGLPAAARKDPEQVSAYVARMADEPEYMGKPAKDAKPEPGKRRRRNSRYGRKIGSLAVKGGALLVTLTLPHQVGDSLDRTMELVSEGFRTLQQCRAYRAERDAYGILGHIRSFEVTHGPNGWHPHLHVLLVLQTPLKTAGAAKDLQAAWLERWNSWLAGEGWEMASEQHGVRVDIVRRDAKAVAAYVAKLQEGDKTKPPRRSNVANELTRADMKTARLNGVEQRGDGGVKAYRVPFEILADFGTDGAATDLELWQEYQLATRGRSAIRWSVGLRSLLLPDEPELSDAAIAEGPKDPLADLVALLAAPLYRAIQRRPYGDAYLLVAAEQGGIDGVRRYVRSLGLNPRGVHPPEAIVWWDEIEEHQREVENRG